MSRVRIQENSVFSLRRKGKNPARSIGFYVLLAKDNLRVVE